MLRVSRLALLPFLVLMHDMRKERLRLTPQRSIIEAYIEYLQSFARPDIRMQKENT
jgi:hypothetical protein